MGSESLLEGELRARIASLEAELTEIRSERDFLLSALERVPVALELYDADGLARWMNQAMVEFLGLPCAEAAVGKFNILTDPFSEQTGLMPVYERAYRGETVVTEEFTIDMERASEEWGASAKSIWFRMILVPKVDSGGRVSSMLAIIFETTQERHMQQTLRLAQRREGLELLAGGVAHDFNNLLTAILGQASILAAGLAEPHEIVQCGEEIVVASQQAAALTSQLLAYAGKGRGTVLPTDLRMLVRETGQLMRVTFAKQAELELSFGDRPAVALVDGAQLKQVLMNLITNARQALSEGGGTVRVSVTVADVGASTLEQMRRADRLEPGSYVILEVADDGCGMDADTAHRVFEPYFTTKEDGHGLGLAATLGIVLGHQGAIHIDSEPGRGSRFRVLLPLSDAEPIAEVVQSSPSRDRSGTVLVADDEPYIRSVVSQLLKRSGYSVIEAEDGRQVISALERSDVEIDLVLMDVMMPGTNGLDALDALRPRRPDLPVVLMSAHSEAGQAAARDDAATWYLPKPFKPEAVLEVLDRASRNQDG